MPEYLGQALAGHQRRPVDSFAPGWPFWEQAARPIEVVRSDWLIPPGGLRAATASSEPIGAST